ncbi:hypothetical protein EON66_10815 [archaeon]|nr:MAG: hypothetical protein EON66_10815 [archaeon]
MSARVHPCRAIIFVFEERLCRQEEAYMQSLGLSGEGPLLVEELKDKDVEVTFENRLQGAGGHADTDLWNPSLFWEPPPIRMFTLRSKRDISSSGADDSAVDAHASATALPAGATGE